MLPDLREPQRFLPRLESAPRDVELEIESPQAEIRVGDFADKCRHNRAATPLGCEQLRARRFLARLSLSALAGMVAASLASIGLLGLTAGDVGDRG